MPEGPAERRVGAQAEGMDTAEHSGILDRVMGGHLVTYHPLTDTPTHR